MVLEGEPSEEILAQPRLGTCQPVAVSGAPHLLDEFHLLVQEVVLQEVTELRVCGENQGAPIQRAWSGSTPGPQWLPRHPEFYPTHLGTAPTRPGKKVQPPCWFCIFKSQGETNPANTGF